jgi:nitrogenase molybdenum-iron protein alpha/beta subunit
LHGPQGCAHHNFSLFHTTALEHDALLVPAILSSGLLEKEIIFGGEEALERTLEDAVSRSPACIFVLSTCIADTIGDDVGAVCRTNKKIPVIVVPTAGFLGGVFQNGVNNALGALLSIADPCSKDGTVNIIGEKNLEYDVEENFSEVSRLLDALGLGVNVRFVRRASPDDLAGLGKASVNILRDSGVSPVGSRLYTRFKTPIIPSFPGGFSGTIRFLERAGTVCEVSFRTAVAEERSNQEEILAEFSDLRGACIALDSRTHPDPGISDLQEIASALRMKVTRDGCRVPLPGSSPVGTAGIRRLLHRWRRAIRA